MKIIETFLSIVISVILSALVIVFLLPRLFGMEPFIVLSGSMEPTIPTGSVIIADKDYGDINIGDIIAFNKGDISVTHRVSGINDDGSFITKGDANASADTAPVARDQVIGTCRFMIPFMGYVASYLRTSPGIIIFSGMIAIYLAITVYQNKRKKLRKTKSIKENSNEES